MRVRRRERSLIFQQDCQGHGWLRSTHLRECVWKRGGECVCVCVLLILLHVSLSVKIQWRKIKKKIKCFNSEMIKRWVFPIDEKSEETHRNTLEQTWMPPSSSSSSSSSSLGSCQRCFTCGKASTRDDTDPEKSPGLFTFSTDHSCEKFIRDTVCVSTSKCVRMCVRVCVFKGSAHVKVVIVHMYTCKYHCKWT